MKLTDYEILYDLPAGVYEARTVKGVRTVTYRAGDSLEVMCHPIAQLTPAAKREIKSRKTGKAMRIVNQRNRERYMYRINEANFSPDAWVLTLTYAYPRADYGLVNLNDLADEYIRRGIPWEYEACKRDIDNYLRRVKRLVAKRCGNAKGFKWSKVIEENQKQPAPGLPCHMHAHMLIEAPNVLREELEAMWKKGRVTQCRHFDKLDDGAMRLARYMAKAGRDAAEAEPGQVGGRRWWTHSRNLKRPEPRISDRKVSRRRAAQVAADVQRHGAALFEQLYPGYKVMELPTVKYSDFGPGAYIYCRMRRRE